MLHPDTFSLWHITPHLWWNLINWWEVPRYHSCSVANAVTPSPHAKTKDHCIMPALYQGSGAKIVTVINRMKYLTSCFGMKRTPKSLPCKQGITAFIFACCSRLQKVYFRPGSGYKIKESAAKKELNPMISLLSHIPGSTTNKWVNLRGKKLNKQSCTSERGSCRLLLQGCYQQSLGVQSLQCS